jgi:hypothetical protein
VNVYYGRANGSDLQIVRLTGAGVLDITFGNSGIADVPVNFIDRDFLPQARMLLRQDNGQLLAGGAATPTVLLLRSAAARFNGDGLVDLTFGKNGVSSVVGLENSTSLLGLSPDGTLVLGAVERSSSIGAQQMRFARMFLSDDPVATLKARAITSQTTRSQILTVSYRDNDGINTVSLGDRNLRITGPGGFLRYATFNRIVSNSSQTGELVARYKLAAPGGEWDSADNGEYVVQLISGSVRDLEGNFAQARFLGSFVVDIA